jgi:hypothetical protein
MSEAPVRRRSGALFWWVFWATLLALALLYTYAQIRISRIVLDEQDRPVVSLKFLETYSRHLPRILADQDTRFSRASEHIEGIIDREIDAAFAPVHAAVPALADFHYSVVGEYAEIVTGLAGDMGADLHRILFEETQFTAQLQSRIDGIQAAARPIIADTLTAGEQDIQASLGLDASELALLRGVVTLSVADAEARFSNAYNAIRTAGAGVGATAVGSILAKTMASKLASKLALKVSAKTVAKAAGIGTGAGAGAVAGAVLGPVGTAVGAVLGATAAWLATDKVIVEVDEYLHRDEFIGEIEATLEAEKRRIKGELRQIYQAYLAEILSTNRERLEGLTTRERHLR